jgi:hypothetical protein
MKTYQVNPVTGAVFLSVLCMGMVGILVILPIACIQWTWNALVTGFTALPEINGWQASLLYLAGAIIAYLTGLIRIDTAEVEALEDPRDSW